MNKVLIWIGVGMSVLYAIGLLALGSISFSAVTQLDLNELGDFLAGTVGPLALIWLVLGFFQQGIELAQNSAALDAQAKELAESAKQHRDLVIATREQLQLERMRFDAEKSEIERSSQPRFETSRVNVRHFKHGSANTTAVDVSLRVQGANLKILSVDRITGCKVVGESAVVKGVGEGEVVTLSYPEGDFKHTRFNITFEAGDSLYRQTFEVVSEQSSLGAVEVGKVEEI